MSNLPARYEPGELVDATIKGARIATRHSSDDGRRVWLEIGGEDYWLPSHASVTVTRAAPPEWPPLTGDIWEDGNETEWMTALSWGGEGVVLFSTDGSGSTWTDFDKMAAEAGPMRLLRRRGWSPTAPAADPEPTPYREPTVSERQAEQIAGMRALADLMDGTGLVGRYGDVSLNTETEGDLRAWASALGGAEISQAEGTDYLHIRFAAELHGLGVRVFHIDSKRPALVEPVETPAEVAAPSIDDDAFDATCGPVPVGGYSATPMEPVKRCDECGHLICPECKACIECSGDGHGEGCSHEGDEYTAEQLRAIEATGTGA